MAAKRRRCLFSGPRAQNSCLGCQIGLVHEIALQECERLRDFLLTLVRGNGTATSKYCSRLSDVRLIEHNRDNQFPLDAVKLGVDWCRVNQYLPLLRFHCCWSLLLDRVGRTSCDASQLERGGSSEGREGNSNQLHRYYTELHHHQQQQPPSSA